MNDCNTILIADDTPVIRKACKRVLERVGYSVIEAKNGNEAVEIVLSEDIDVALLDIKMPGLDGIEILKTIKAEKPFVEVIMMTGYATEEIVEEVTRIGASDLLTKPFASVKLLIKTVEEAVAQKSLKECARGNAKRGKITEHIKSAEEVNHGRRKQNDDPVLQWES